MPPVPFEGSHAHPSFPDKGEIAVSHSMRLNWLWKSQPLTT